MLEKVIKCRCELGVSFQTIDLFHIITVYSKQSIVLYLSFMKHYSEIITIDPNYDVVWRMFRRRRSVG